MPKMPSEHQIARAMKNSEDLALVEAVLVATPIDTAAKLTAMRAFEHWWTAWYRRQCEIRSTATSNRIAVAVLVEALGLRDVRLHGDNGIAARMPGGSRITISGVTGAFPRRDPVDDADGTTARDPCTSPDAAVAVRSPSSPNSKE